ncbi:hypothetical protein OGAPHI_002611 [Ogataea philodendri]|uniref:DM2 domain-containing protein n=1 Tax=Ogataea philodendri TaxID=1378263 RepID=A0A9P8T8C2_9ASCO|nr:uncharacterized protein OGAPHI_002611 [Ogataea philodendri]KAH3668856.1 hypothetical protein OGAPHI_002611 [Ogataea philodendri]
MSAARMHRDKHRKLAKQAAIAHGQGHVQHSILGNQGQKSQGSVSQGHALSANMKPTDVVISKSIASVFPEKTELYHKLRAKERELDLMINKKVIDLQEYQQSVANGLVEDPNDTQILRIFIFNTSENQPWQVKDQQVDNLPPPSWTLRIEGRLLNDTEPADSPKRKKFSSFLSGISVELKAKDGNDEELQIGSVNDGPSSRVIEWHDSFGSNEPERMKHQFDGLDIKRAGSSIPQSELPENESADPSEKEIVCNIVIQPKTYPIKLQVVNDALVELLGSSEISQPDCIHKIFNYIKMNNLFEVQTVQDKQGGNQQPQQVVTVKSDDLLYRIFAVSSLTFAQIMEIVSTKLLKPVEPIKLQYSINTLKETTLGDLVIDLKVNSRLVNPSFKPGAQQLAEISEMINQSILNKQTAKDLEKVNESLRLNFQLLNYSKFKYDFYKKLSEKPVEFLKEVLDKNTELLKILSSDSFTFGNDGLLDEELVRRSEFYTDEFLSEHINILFNSGRI